MENLVLHTFNKKKILEALYIKKYNKVEDIIKKEFIYYDKKNNINEEIIKSYDKEPDLLIIDFEKSKDDYLDLEDIPVYPIFYKNVFYISPICVQQINGFSNCVKNTNYLIIDFIERIFQVLGGLISDKDFIYKPIDYIDLSSGIKNLMYKDDVQSEWFVNNIPEFMTKYISSVKSGWFANNNRYAIDWVFENYKINTTMELGSYYGKSSKYFAEKNPNGKLYCFDEFKNLLMTDFVIDKISVIDKIYKI